MEVQLRRCKLGSREGFVCGMLLLPSCALLVGGGMAGAMRCHGDGSTDMHQAARDGKWDRLKELLEGRLLETQMSGTRNQRPQFMRHVRKGMMHVWSCCWIMGH